MSHHEPRGRRPSPKTRPHRCLADGNGRTLAHALLIDVERPKAMPRRRAKPNRYFSQNRRSTRQPACQGAGSGPSTPPASRGILARSRHDAAPVAMLYCQLTTRRFPGRPREVGEKPTRSRHCKRGVRPAFSTQARGCRPCTEHLAWNTAHCVTEKPSLCRKAGRRGAAIRESGNLVIGPSLLLRSAQLIGAGTRRVVTPEGRLCMPAFVPNPLASLFHFRLALSCLRPCGTRAPRPVAAAADLHGRVTDPDGRAVPGRAWSWHPGRSPSRPPATATRAEPFRDRSPRPPASYELRVVARRLPGRPGRDRRRSRTTRPRDGDPAAAQRLVRVDRRVGVPGGRPAVAHGGQRHRHHRRRSPGEAGRHRRRRAAPRPRPGRRAQRRPRRADVALSARRRVGLHARAGRRHAGQRVRRRVRLLAAARRGHRARRSGARAAERAVRLGRDRRRRPDRHAARRAGARRRPRRSRRPRHPPRGHRRLRVPRRLELGRRRRAAWRATGSRDRRRPPASASPTTTTGMAQGSGTLGWRQAAGAEVRGTGQRAGRTSAGSRDRSDRTRLARSRRWIASPAAPTTSTRPASAWSCPGPDRDVVRQRIQVSRADLHDRFTSPYGLSDSGTTRLVARAQTDFALGGGAGVARARIPARARAQHVHHRTGRPAGSDRARHDRLFRRGAPHVGSGCSPTAGLRVEQIRRDAARGQIRTATRRGLRSPRHDGLGQSRRRAGLAAPLPRRRPPAAVRLDARARQRRHRHPPARRARDRVHRQPRPQAGAQPERGGRPRCRPSAASALLVEATGFVNRYDDLIVAVGRSLQDASRYRTDNISNARARGLEMAVSARSALGPHRAAGYTFVDTHPRGRRRPSRRRRPSPSGDPLLRRPRHRAALDWSLSRARLTAFAQRRHARAHARRRADARHLRRPVLPAGHLVAHGRGQLPA